MLLANDPQKEPASFTRFVLPIGYQLEAGEAKVSGPYFREAVCTDWLHSGAVHGKAAMPTQERREYLTPETARALYSRACWLVQEGGAEETLQVPLPSGDKTVYLRPAGLVLMEWKRELARLEHLDKAPKKDGEKPKASLLASGFLVLESWFPDSSNPTLDDLLLWNELARYFRQPWETHLKDTSHAPLLNALGIHVRGDYLQRWSRWLELPILVTGASKRPGSGSSAEAKTDRYLRLMPHAWLEGAEALVAGSSRNIDEKPSTHWMVQADNRCHVWTCAVHEDESLKTMAQNLGTAEELAPPGSLPWLRLLNVDKPGAVDKLTPFEKRWLPDHTYTRWTHFSALYGFTSHSGAMMATPCCNPDTWQHFRVLYFDQLLLMLYVRTCLFRFSERLSVLAAKAGETLALSEGSTERKAGLQALAKVFRDLRWEFAQFTNLYQFPLISHQQQALEMYAMLRRHMVVEEFFQNVRTEIETTQTLLADAVAERQAQATLKLTVVAFLGLLLSVAVGAMGSDALVNGLQRYFNEGAKLALGEVLFGGLIVSFVLLALLHLLFRLPWMQRLVRKTFGLDLDP